MSSRHRKWWGGLTACGACQSALYDLEVPAPVGWGEHTRRYISDRFKTVLSVVAGQGLPSLSGPQVVTHFCLSGHWYLLGCYETKRSSGALVNARKVVGEIQNV